MGLTGSGSWRLGGIAVVEAAMEIWRWIEGI